MDYLSEDMVDARQESERDCDAQALEDELAAQHPAWQHALLIGQSGAAVMSEEPTT